MLSQRRGRRFRPIGWLETAVPSSLEGDVPSMEARVAFRP